MVAIVTGAGSGIGRAVTLALAQAGHAVVLAGRRSGALGRVECEADPARARAVAVPTDIADQDAVARLFARAVDRFGRVDLLFNNAGVGAPAAALEDITI